MPPIKKMGVGDWPFGGGLELSVSGTRRPPTEQASLFSVAGVLRGCRQSGVERDSRWGAGRQHNNGRARTLVFRTEGGRALRQI